jgi:hypothetical protein
MAPTKKSSEKRQQTLLSCGFTMGEKGQNTLLRCGFTRITKPYSKAPSKLDDLLLKRASQTPGIGDFTPPIGANPPDILKDSTLDVPSITKKEIKDIQVSIPPCKLSLLIFLSITDALKGPTSEVPTATTKEENSRLSVDNTQFRAELEAELEEPHNEAAENSKKSQSQTENAQVCGPQSRYSDQDYVFGNCSLYVYSPAKHEERTVLDAKEVCAVCLCRSARE